MMMAVVQTHRDRRQSASHYRQLSKSIHPLPINYCSMCKASAYSDERKVGKGVKKVPSTPNYLQDSQVLWGNRSLNF
jgi:hypothetical protein